MAVILPVVVGLVAALLVVTVSAEVFYLFYWRKRPLAGPRLNNVTVAPVNEGEQVESRGEEQTRAAVVIDVTCAEYQISALQQDLVEKLFPSYSSGGALTHESANHTMVGPPRMLFTIREETREELESLDMDLKCGGRSRRSSRSKSMGDIPLSPLGFSPLSQVGTPFVTPLSSPDVFSSPYGTPTRSSSPLLPPPLPSPRSHFSSSSPVLYKTSCRIMFDYPPKPHLNPNPNSNFVPVSPPPPPPLAPPSPTRPTFSFLASRNFPVSYSRSSSTENSVKNCSPIHTTPCSTSPPPAAPGPAHAPAPHPPVRKPLFQHLAMSSPVHKQAECVVKAPSPLRTCTYENHDDDEEDSRTPSVSPRSSSSPSSPSSSSSSFSPDRSPNFYSTPTPSFEPISISIADDEMLMSASSKGSIFNRRQEGRVFSPLSSPSDGDTPYASPLLVIPSQTQAQAYGSDDGEGEVDFQTSSPIRPSVTLWSTDKTEKDDSGVGEKFVSLMRREGVVMSSIVLPTQFSYRNSRTKTQSFHPTPPSMLSTEVTR